MRDGAGAPMGGVVVIQNVTEIKETQKRLHETIADLSRATAELHGRVQREGQVVSRREG